MPPPEEKVPAPAASSLPAKRSPEPTVPVKVPAKYYPNSNTSKAKILKENKNKSGIYMWKISKMINDISEAQII